MPVYVFAIINAVLAVLVVGTIAGFLAWSIATQHRHHGCEDIRLARRRRTSRRRSARELERPAQEIVLG
jgi:hypothetical protein